MADDLSTTTETTTATPTATTDTTQSTEMTDTTVAEQSQDSVTEAGFCSADERVSTHTCNSLHPAISMDQYGNRGITWHDNRDGDFEIYLKFIASLLSTEAQAQALSSFYDADSGRVGSFPCSAASGFSGFSGLDLTGKNVTLLSSRCVTDENADTALFRFSDGRLDVNQQLSAAYLTAGEGVDFVKTGVNPGATIVIETGLNASKTLLVISAVSNKTLRVSYDPTLRSDTGFVYSVTANPQVKLSSCELRLTCEKGASLFPDIVSDRKCRWHVVYQDDKSGKNEIYYVQVGPPEKVMQTCPPNEAGAYNSGGGFSNIPEFVPGQTYIFTSPDTKKYYPITGDVSQFFAYGNRNVPLPEGTGQHILFRDWYGNNGKWVGVSKGSDYSTWQAQATAIGNIPDPPLGYEYQTAFTEGGEFGSVHDFSNLVFQIQAPPDLGIDIRTLVLPIVPRCTPPVSVKNASNVSQNTSDLVEAPKKPLPPTFVDPVDISSLLESPYVRFTSDPERFTLEGDNSGTVFTNVLLEDASGELSRVLFKKDISGNLVKFVLGMTKCGDGPCALKVSSASASLDGDKDNRFGLRLRVWQGPDYRLDEGLIDSASTTADKLLADKEFYFDPSENFTTFAFEPEELKVPRGSIVYFSLTALENSDYAVIAKGPGTTIWSANNLLGNFNQYNDPYTLPPYQGLSAPVYYDGYLMDIPNESEATGEGEEEGEEENPYATNPVVLTKLKQPCGMCYMPSHDKLLVSSNRLWLNTVNYEATVKNFLTDYSYLPVYPRMCSVWENIGKHKAGTTYFLETNHIAKINYDKTVEKPWTFAPWASDLCIDYSGNWNNDLLYIRHVSKNTKPASYASAVFRIDPETKASSQIAYIDDAFCIGMISIPNNPSKYGTYAGKIWIGRYPYKGGYLIDRDGKVKFASDFNKIITSFAIIPPNSHLYIVDAYYQQLYGMHKSRFEENVGDIVISSPWANVYLLSFKDGFSVQPILKGIKPGVFQQVNFAPYGVMPLCSSQEDCENPIVVPTEEPRPESEVCNDVERFVFTPPIRITNSGLRNSEHPRLAISGNNNIWTTYHSDRDGGYDIYLSRFSATCDIWNASATGGEDIRLSNFAKQNRRAMFPKIAIGKNEQVHVTFQATDENGKWQVFYTQGTSGNNIFSEPIQLTKSSTGALMPDIEVSYIEKEEVITIVWHDSRSGTYQIYAAQKAQGNWRSSYQDGADIRITNDIGNDMFPKIKADDSGNLRVTFHSDRTGRQEVFMSTYVAAAKTWSSSGTGQSDLKVSTGPKNSMFSDLDMDPQGGTAVAWHDDRHIDENPDLHEEVYNNYCISLSHVGGQHFPPLITNDEVFLERDFEFVDCVDYKPLTITTVPEVCLQIRAPGATYWRAANSGESFSDWSSFKPNVDLETMTVPWKLTCGNGLKEVCVQVQNQDSVGFPLCKTVSLVSPPVDFDVQFYADEDMTESIPQYKGRPAIKAGDTWVKITSPQPLLLPPTFDVVHQGYRIITNQKTVAVSGFSGTAGIGSFIGQNYNGVFSSVSLQQFKGRFTIHKEDGYNYLDGLARVIVKERTVCGDYNDVITRSPTTECPNERALRAGPPPIYSGTSGFSGPSGFSGMHGPYNGPATASMWMTIEKTIDSSQIVIEPEIDPVPYKITMGAIAQPFVVTANVTTNLNITFKGARRKIPSWLSSFETRELRVDLVSDLLTNPTVIGTAYINALLLPEVDFDPITGLMIDPLSLEDVVSTTIQISGDPTLSTGVTYGISFSDDTYYPLLGTYGANAKYFVVAYGTSVVSGQSAYYYRDY